MTTNNNQFAVLPTEVWLAIISYLAPETYLALKLTSSYMRGVIDANAARIANGEIIALYRREASILQSTLVDGWLVPTHESVLLEEERIKARKSSIPPTSLVITKLSEPGPQYLCFLRENSLHIRVYHEVYGPTTDNQVRDAAPIMAIESGPGALNSFASGNQRDKFTETLGLVCVRRFLNRLDRIAGGNGNGLKMTINEAASTKCTEDAMAWFYN